MKCVIAVVFAVAIAGCGPKATPGASSARKAPGAPTLPAAFLLDGPGGSVTLGDGLPKAKAAFPAPKGAQVFDKSMNFAILGTDGWSWALDKEHRGFEVALKDGKSFAFAVTEMTEKPDPDAVKNLIAKLGEPARKATGKTAEALVWESGDNARIVIVLKQKALLFGPGTMTMIGPKKDLAMLSFRADDPETIVRIMDAGAEQMEQLEKSQKK